MKKLTFLAIIYVLSTNFANAAMSISSPDFKQGEMIAEKNVFNGFGCSGQNIWPQVQIINVPKDTKSLALTIHDPDAPTGSGWWHWIVYDMPSRTRNIFSSDKKISREATFGREAVFGRNDFGTFDYGGPCPPVGHGKHRYILTVYALKVDRLELPENPTAALIGYNINSNTIEKASITSYYQR
ncbi:MAG: YbcL [Rickettsiaceae bacterium]|jgi:Raf kinase inhibitor-like YbhB/YbcL family protein|nr:YbcL [Rickettsiaceae bacterium]